MSVREVWLCKVAFWLPARRKSEALARIRRDLDAHLAAISASSDASLSEAGLREGLRSFGSPVIVATRYTPAEPLIALGLMVAWWRVLTLACGAVLLVQVTLLMPALARAVSGRYGLEITNAGNQTVYGLLMAFTSVTLVFAVLSRFWPDPRPTDEQATHRD